MSVNLSKSPESSLTLDAASQENTRLETHGPTPTELAYVAGYIDGEGCLRSNKGGVDIQIKNTYPHVLYEIQRLFGGTVNVVRRSKRDPNHRTTFNFSIFGDGARNMAILLLPYLREKADQAHLLLMVNKFKSGSAMRDFIVRRLKELKKVDYNGQP